jgi:hypothetical protein
MIADDKTNEEIIERTADGKFLIIIPREHQDPAERLVIPVEHARDAAENPELYAATQKCAAQYIQRVRQDGVHYDITSDVTPLHRGGVLHVHVRVSPYDEAESDLLRRAAPMTMP